MHSISLPQLVNKVFRMLFFALQLEGDPNQGSSNSADTETTNAGAEVIIALLDKLKLKGHVPVV